MQSLAKQIGDEITALEQSYWDAMKNKDGRRASELSGATCLVTGPRGVTAIDKAKMGEMTADDGWTLHAYAFDEVKVITPAPNVAVIAYTVRQTITMGGKRMEMRAADSSTWIKGPAGWECSAHSETVLADAPPT